MKTTKVEKVITTLKDSIGHLFKETPYRNLDMSQVLELTMGESTEDGVIKFGFIYNLRPF